MKKILALFITAVLLSTSIFAAAPMPGIMAKSAVLADVNGNVIYEKNSHEKLPPASVTKIMTMLLVMEALDSGTIKMEDMVVTSAHAADMGGTQIYLEPNEKMSVKDMLKSVAVASANDAAVALAEHIGGSEEGFVAMMNEKAKKLGMNDTTFKNSNGLDADGHVTSAYDIMLMSVELLKHTQIKDFTTIWMDSVRGGAFGLANTNKMLKSYSGLTGLKTGWTSNANYCISATAKRDGKEFIATIMGADTSQNRTKDAATMLNYGFANYTFVDVTPDGEMAPVKVLLGEKEFVRGQLAETVPLLLEKNAAGNIEKIIEMASDLQAPVEKKQKIGVMKIKSNGEEIMSIPIVAAERVERLSWFGIFCKMMNALLMKK